jgi:hypothetical protein
MTDQAPEQTQGNAPAADVAANSAPEPSPTAPAAASTGGETASAEPSSTEPQSAAVGPGEPATNPNVPPLGNGESAADGAHGEVAASATTVDPAATHELPVTHESFLAEIVAAVRRDCQGISHHINELLAKAEKHFGL